MKQFVSATLILAALAAIAASLASNINVKGHYGNQKVVYHINYEGGADDKKYRGALRNIQNHINAVGAANIDLKVVLHGNGLTLLKNAKVNDKLQSSVTSLREQNVSFNVCNNTLKGRKISYKDDLFKVSEGDIVPSGVAELAHLQQLGYVYIRP